MKQTYLLESLLGETRLAVIEDGALCEMYVERPDTQDVTGSIYLGRVENVLPGMNAAFVDIGLEKKGFLYAGDAMPDRPGTGGEKRIEAIVHPGQELAVQVMKAQSGQKGHRLTRDITLPGRLMALTPGTEHIGVSKKIADPAERERLRKLIDRLRGADCMGAIVRTAAEGATEDNLSGEWKRLIQQWSGIARRASKATAPRLLFSNAALGLKCVRDMLNADTQAVWVEGEALYSEVRSAAESLAPEWADRVILHEGSVPLFDLYRVDAQLDKALRKYVWLKSGGSLVIEETEAMTVIDVNTGKFTGKRDLEETIFRLNCEAAEEIVRQLRLRDAGGIVVVDFIDMESPERCEALVERLRELAKTDRNRLTVVGMTGLGLVELTRKKARKSLSRQLTHTCSACGGDGLTFSHETVARRVLREIWKKRRQGAKNPMLVTANPFVAHRLKRIGAPEGGTVYVIGDETVAPGEWEITPADEANLPEKCKRI